MPLAQLFEAPEHVINIPDWYANSVLDPITGRSMEYRELITNPTTKDIWCLSAVNEFGRLAQGVEHIKGTDTIRFIRHHEVPCHKTLRPQKAEQHCTRLTVSGNPID
jgi:hypothetical protein